MANRLTMALIDSSFTQRQRGWAARRIAHEVSIHRVTVARYLQQRDPNSKPDIAPVGSAAGALKPTPAISFLGSAVEGTESRLAVAPVGSTGAEGPLPC